MKRTKPEVLMSPVVEKLPEDIAAGIGHIIARFTRLEDLLRTTTYVAMGIDPKRGRIAVREPRAEEQVTMIEDLLILLNIEPWPDIAQLKKHVAAAERDRDKFAHGLFVTNPKTGQLAVSVTRGSHNLGPHELRRTRKMLPEGQLFGREELDSITASIEGAINAAHDLHRKVLHARRALNDKQREQDPPAHPPPDQNESKP
jgi:hypothetical protein